VFDDWYSIGHTILGILASFFWFLIIIFFIYELIEFCFKKKEKKADYVGDILEFSLGTLIGSCLVQLLGLNLLSLLSGF